MPTVTDWLMVGITAVYVVATIFICRANIKSANATRDQVAESKRQFDETQRLATMPFLSLEHIKDGTLDSDFEVSVPVTKGFSLFCRHSNVFRLKNIGNGTATTIVYTWTCHKKDICETECFPINAVSVGSPHNITFFYTEDEAPVYPSKAVLELQYNDLLGHTYEQKFFFSFRDGDSDDILDKCVVGVPVYRGKLLYSLKSRESKENG